MRRLLLSLALLVAVSANAQEDDWQRGYEQYKKQAMQEYEDYRKQCLAEYIDYVRQAWKEYGVKAPEQPPKEERIRKPVQMDEPDMETATWLGDWMRKLGKNVKTLSKKALHRKGKVMIPKEVIEMPDEEQPQPVAEIVEVPDEPNPYHTFRVFGTEFRVRFGDNCRFTLRGVSENDVADAMGLFLKPQFDNMLHDCFQERERSSLSDWAYYEMLKAFTDEAYGKDSNEATLVLSWLFSSSGYKVRLGRLDSTLYLLVASSYHLFHKAYVWISSENAFFYELSGRLSKDSTQPMPICEAKYEKEGNLRLQIPSLQRLAVSQTEERTITSKLDKDFSFTIRPNANYLKFLDSYPDGWINGHQQTRWAIRANMPMEQSVAEQLYPLMRKKLEGLTKVQAVEQLLSWVSSGLVYGNDDERWGRDRVFFAEETLHYDICDCEDKSILLSRLVRDLVGLDVVLLFYRFGTINGLRQELGHIATAVCIPDGEGVQDSWDNYVIDGRKYYVCDPCYINNREESISSIGSQMFYYKDKENQAKVVKLEKASGMRQ